MNKVLISIVITLNFTSCGTVQDAATQGLPFGIKKENLSRSSLGLFGGGVGGCNIKPRSS